MQTHAELEAPARQGRAAAEPDSPRRFAHVARPSTLREVAQRQRIETLFGASVQMTGPEGATHTTDGEAALARPSSPRSAPSNVLQRQLFHDGTLYKDGDDVSALGGLPQWTPLQLTSPSTFVLSRDKSAWVPDAQLEFKRYKGTNKLAERTVGASSIKKFGDVGFAPKDEGERVGPKHPEKKYVKKVTIVKSSLVNNGHWSLQCEVLGGKNTKGMKVDLTSTAYRVLYGATQDSTEPKKVDFELKTPVSLPIIYETFVNIAKTNGKWTGQKDYNCQDFALEMLRRLSVSDEFALKEEENWREITKR
jgi:hypothetical protein